MGQLIQYAISSAYLVAALVCWMLIFGEQFCFPGVLAILLGLITGQGLACKLSFGKNSTLSLINSLLEPALILIIGICLTLLDENLQEPPLLVSWLIWVVMALTLYLPGVLVSLRQSDNLHQAGASGSVILGVALGSACFQFILAPSLTLNIIILLLGSCGLISNLILWGTARRNDSLTSRACSDVRTTRTIDRRSILLAFLIGLGFATYQYLLMQVLSAVLPMQLEAWVLGFTLTLVLFYFGSKARRCVHTLLPLTALGVGLLVPLLSHFPYLVFVIRTQFPSLTDTLSFHLLFWVIALILLAPLSGLGIAWSLLLQGSSFKNLGPVGKSEAYLLLTRTLGMLLALLLSGTVALCCSLELISRLACGLFAIITTLALLFNFQGLQGSSKLPVLVCLTAMLFTLYPTDYRVLAVSRMQAELSSSGFLRPASFKQGLTRGHKLLETRRSFIHSFSIVEFEPSEDAVAERSRSLTVDGVTQVNSLSDRVLLQMVATLPAITTSAASIRAAVIGYELGTTSQALLDIPQLNSLDIFEPIKSIHSLSSSQQNSDHVVPKWHRDEIFPALLKIDDLFSVVIVTPKHVFPLDSKRLTSPQFYRVIAQKLEDHGSFAQAVSLRGTSLDSIRAMLTNIAEVFHEVRLFQYADGLVVLARKQRISPNQISEISSRFMESKVLERLKSINLSAPEQLFALEAWLPPLAYKNSTSSSLLASLIRVSDSRPFDLNQFVAEDLPPSSNDWRWSQVYAEHSLLKYWYTQNSNADLQSLLAPSCGGVELKLVEPNWRFSRSVCRDLMVAMLASGKVRVPNYLMPEFLWLEDFQAGESVPAELRDAAQQSRDISYFTQFHSIFTRLSPKHLIWRLADCYVEPSLANLECRAQIIRSLSYTGFVDLAEFELAKLKRDGGPKLNSKTVQGLEEYLAQCKELLN